MGDKFVVESRGKAKPCPPTQLVKEIPGEPGEDQDRIEVWKREIAACYRVMLQLVDMDPNDVFRHLSQFSGRASEIRSQIGPLESKREMQFRVRIIDPFIEECDRQFKIHSRLMAITEMDARLAGGRFA